MDIQHDSGPKGKKNEEPGDSEERLAELYAEHIRLAETCMLLADRMYLVKDAVRHIVRSELKLTHRVANRIADLVMLRIDEMAG